MPPPGYLGLIVFKMDIKHMNFVINGLFETFYDQYAIELKLSSVHIGGNWSKLALSFGFDVKTIP